MLAVINLLLIFVVLFLQQHQRSKYVSKSDLAATVESVREAVQDVADKVDADFHLNDSRLKVQESSLISVSTSLARLANAAGFEMKDGLWAKAPVAKKETPVAKKATAKKGAK